MNTLAGSDGYAVSTPCPTPDSTRDSESRFMDLATPLSVAISTSFSLICPVYHGVGAGASSTVAEMSCSSSMPTIMPEASSTGSERMSLLTMS